MSVNFNAGSATTYSNSTLVFGGNDGAVKFPTDIEIPEPYYSRLLLRDFMMLIILSILVMTDLP